MRNGKIRRFRPRTHNKHSSRRVSHSNKNNGIHPSVGIANTRLLNKMRCSAVPAIYGAGMHPNQSVWVYEERTPEPTFFKPVNRFRK